MTIRRAWTFAPSFVVACCLLSACHTSTEPDGPGSLGVSLWFVGSVVDEEGRDVEGEVEVYRRFQNARLERRSGRIERGWYRFPLSAALFRPEVGDWVIKVLPSATWLVPDSVFRNGRYLPFLDPDVDSVRVDFVINYLPYFLPGPGRAPRRAPSPPAW